VGSSRNRHLSTMILYFSRTMNGLKNESWRSNSLSCPRVIASFLRTCGRRAIAEAYQIRLIFALLTVYSSQPSRTHMHCSQRKPCCDPRSSRGCRVSDLVAAKCRAVSIGRIVRQLKETCGMANPISGTSLPDYLTSRRFTFHSYRNATIGSTRVACLAGTYAARIATVKKKAGTPRNDIGSRALTPNRIARNR